MSRTVPAALLTALDADQIEPFYAVDMAFETANIRLWTGYGDKTIGSDTYTGSGSLLTIDGLEEASDLSARGTTLTLSGLSSTILTYALTEEYQGRTVTIYWGVGSETVEVFRGYMDQMAIQDSGETSAISLTVESRLVMLERPNVRRYTSESHKQVRKRKWLDDGNSGDPAADTFFDWVQGLQDTQIVWGRNEA
jgi:tRNA G37 N-methylase TrmD